MLNTLVASVFSAFLMFPVFSSFDFTPTPTPVPSPPFLPSLWHYPYGILAEQVFRLAGHLPTVLSL